MRMTLIALILATGALAQGPRPDRGGPNAEFRGGILRAGVKNAPFSADVITESTRTLADGNRIHQVVNSRVYRDSEGRTRREQAVNLNGLAPDANMPQMVFIHDPVAGVVYTLNARDRTGTKLANSGRGPIARELEAPRGGGESRWMGRRGAADPNTKTESLGRQTIEGVQAEGRRVTMTIPAGQAGNDLPIQVVTERWYSPDLGATVLSRQSNPLVGEVVTRLTNISRGEPAHALFEPPPDYKIGDAPAGLMRSPGGARQEKR